MVYISLISCIGLVLVVYIANFTPTSSLSTRKVSPFQYSCINSLTNRILSASPIPESSIDLVTKIRGGKTFAKMSLFRRSLMTLRRLAQPFIPSFLQNVITGKRKQYKRSVSLPNKPRTTPGTASGGSNRVEKEMQEFIKNPPDNCRLIVGSNMRSWVVELRGVKGTVYADEVFRLKLNFPKDYPAKPPSVFFLKPCPKHVHVYTNGDICLNFLGRDWRPTMSAQMLVASILSMLSSAKEKKIPQDNALHSDSSPGQQQNWMYHDDRC